MLMQKTERDAQRVPLEIAMPMTCSMCEFERLRRSLLLVSNSVL